MNLCGVTRLFVKNPVSRPPPLGQETGFLPESVACSEVFRKKPGFWGLADRIFGLMGDRIEEKCAIEFERNVRSNLRERCDRLHCS